MLDLVIVGAGMMGANHARSARVLKDVRIRLVVDRDPDRARLLAEPLGSAWATELPVSLAGLDGAVIATPSHLHCEVGLPFISAGIPVLIEKPLASTLEDARALSDAADRSGSLLMVGHIEQFNAAVLALDDLLDDVVHIQADRIGPFSGRVKEGVISDLMIHDLEIVRRIAGSPVTTVQAIAGRLRSPTEDYASALLCFENGLTATLTASRVSQQKIRRLEITQTGNSVSVDLLRQDVTVHKVLHSEFLSSDGPGYRQSGVIEIPFMDRRGEPLALQFQHFVDCILTSSPPRVSGRHGVSALELALWVERVAAGRQEDGRQEGGRQEGGRQEGGRQEGGRQEGGRQEGGRLNPRRGC
jgi:predicted dehydrogenase